LCELTRKDTQKAVNEIYRILRPGGVFVHGVLSPYPENKAQELVILADEYSADLLFEKEWFSPPADELAGMLHQAGFSAIGVKYFEEVLRFEGDIAFEQVKTWMTKPEFFEKYSEDLKNHGLEYPMEQVVYCWK
jgi:SAM-dependent methyltransferase